jgi:hypothetical protein
MGKFSQQSTDKFLSAYLDFNNHMLHFPPVYYFRHATFSCPHTRFEMSVYQTMQPFFGGMRSDIKCLHFYLAAYSH